MQTNRISSELPVRTPQAPTPPWTPSTFVFCPMPWVAPVTPEQWMMQQWVYQCAFEQAKAVVRPSILERDLLGVWN
jgi:hypothetical protein